MDNQTDIQSTQALLRPMADKAAIGVSFLCVLHCLALPIAAASLPVISALGLDDEIFHLWLIVIVLPLSVFALTLGCRVHGNMKVLSLGMLGLGILCLAPLVGHDLLGELGEKGLTVAGAALIAVSHLRNFLLCRRSDDCEC